MISFLDEGIVLVRNSCQGLAFPVSAGIMRACFVNALLGRGGEAARLVPFV